ncbi:MAG TPA: hypothetical protein VMB52_05980 [Verrucomicrobiae bacterium]|nr:hypothetical protein [Verrucomicrobiae bacterium]
MSRTSPAYLSGSPERAALVHGSWAEYALRLDTAITLVAMVFSEVPESPVPGFDPKLFIAQLSGIHPGDIQLAVDAMKSQGLIVGRRYGI